MDCEGGDGRAGPPVHSRPHLRPYHRWFETADDRFAVALLTAVIVHALIALGITFVKPRSPPRSSTLDVVLVASETTAPAEAEFIAQANQDGGATSERPEPPAAPLPAPFLASTPEVVANTPPPAAPGEQRELAPPESAPVEPEPPKVLTQEVLAVREQAPPPTPPKPRPRPRRLQAAAAPAPAESDPLPPKPPVDAATLVTRSLAYASLNATVDDRLREYASRPRRKWITARTRESKYAAYMDAWRSKVERIGNLNYPDGARRHRLSGSLLLDVALNADGSVHDITLRRSSGQRILDDAAIRIVRLSAPFAPFPADIRRETDILHIERTWQFLSSNRLRSR